MAEDEGTSWFLRSRARLEKLKQLEARLQRSQDNFDEIAAISKEMSAPMAESEQDGRPPRPTPETADEVFAILQQEYGKLPRRELLYRASERCFQELDRVRVLDGDTRSLLGDALEQLRGGTDAKMQ